MKKLFYSVAIIAGLGIGYFTGVENVEARPSNGGGSTTTVKTYRGAYNAETDELIKCPTIVDTHRTCIKVTTVTIITDKEAATVATND
ncbi:MAG: hypothetical protein ACEPOV_01195 [Hyphomicrobiales bacterium]